MSEIERRWTSDAFDAIGILLPNGEIEIEGTDGDEVEISGRIGRRFTEPTLEPRDRWLLLQFISRPAEGELKLRLPKKKAWVIDLTTMRGDVEVRDIQARLRVMTAKGDIEIENCRGRFTLASASGDIEMDGCMEAEAPERPPLPPVDDKFQMPPMPEGAEGGPKFEFGFSHGKHGRWAGRFGPGWFYSDADPDEWAKWGNEMGQWGTQIGEQAGLWAQQFVGRFIGQLNWPPENAGVNIRTGSGDGELIGLQAKRVSIGVGSGDISLRGGRVEGLEISSGHGDIDCDGALPVKDWSIDVRSGDVSIALPPATQARLDLATRHGSIQSEIPLVRVGRQGPESRFGGRMVGAVGAEGQGTEIKVSSRHGDIDIHWSGGTAEKRAAPQPEPARSEAGEATESAAQAEQVQPARKYGSQMEILEALARGELSVEEAEKLIRTL